MATEPQVVLPSPAKPQIRRANRDAIKAADIGYMRWRTVAPADHTRADVLNPGYLWHAHDRLQPHQIVEIAHETCKFFVEVYIVKVDKPSQSIVYHVIRDCDWSKATEVKNDLDAAVVERKGSDKWRVRLGEVVLIKGLTTEDDAREWLSAQKAAA